jgi:hypothetical protein
MDFVTFTLAPSAKALVDPLPASALATSNLALLAAGTRQLAADDTVLAAESIVDVCEVDPNASMVLNSLCEPKLKCKKAFLYA